MSTRAIITVSDTKHSYHIYKHSNGSPDMILPAIEKAMKFAWTFPRFEAGDFAAAIVRRMKTGKGDVYLTNDPKNHSCIDYHYKVYEFE